MNAHDPSTRRIALLSACGALAVTALMSGCSTEPRGSNTSSSTTSSLSPTSTGSSGNPAPLAATGTSTSTATASAYVPAVMPTPEETRGSWREGVRLYDAGEYAASAAQLEIAASGRTDDARTHFLLGLALWKSGKPDLAEPVLERAAQLEPKSVKTFVNLARVRLEIDEAATALEAADSAVALEGTNAAALHQRGRALAMLNRRDEAIETLRQAHGADPNDGYIANTLGYWLIQTGHPDDAVPFLESARDRLTNVSYVRNNLGVAYERTGRRDDALAEYRAAVESGDTGGKAASSLARLGGEVAQPVASTPTDGKPVQEGTIRAAVIDPVSEPPHK